MINVVLLYIVGSTLLISLIALIGIISLSIKQKILERITLILVSLSAGALMGGAFFHLIPEAVEQTMNTDLFYYVMLGFLLFFFIEKIFHWRHCHKGRCDIHTFTYMNLIGDFIHNFVDGLVIAGSFLIDINLGITTSIAIALHEIPQEIGDYAVLIYGGFSKYRALILNFLIALSVIFGGLVGYFISTIISDMIIFLLPLTAGGFIYIASCDLIPEIRKTETLKASIGTFTFFILGLLIMWMLTLI